ncbi:hypothetical protein DMA12_23495 [Amycolatopsis balhimycina DSM 5908]|uniref:Uncharacterized protein n=1 Tax=Amycolatopsis balhimycina DSM 5908 TaxID=1081091 RepID=A0A428WEU5_AMYBA|nr:hypothetical protein [Amycolatopsis balhimycina]RSM41591.1 hypothetical protein DMA12_23495 [Amycolatopsis balhimycina DSM 5908]
MTLWNGADYPSSLGFLIDCLEQIPPLRDPGSRRLCLELLSDRLGKPLVVEELPTARASLIGIVQACRRRDPRALSAFVDAIEQMEPGSIPVQRARSAVEDMVALDEDRAALDLVTEDDRQELLHLLGENPSGRLAELVRAAAGPAAELTSADHRPADALATLERINAQPDGVPPLLLFVEYLAAAAADDRRAAGLRAWNDRQAARLGMTEQIKAVRLMQATEPAVAEKVVAYLVVRIEPDLLEAGTLVVVHWRHNDPAAWRPLRSEPFSGNLDAVRAHMAELVAEAETGWAKDASAIRIEFLLPYSLLNLPVDQWDLEAGSSLPRPLGLHYQVVVRSLDRARSPRWHREWRRRWDLLKQVPAGLTTPEEHWLWSDGAKWRHLTALDAKLAAQKKVVSLVLRSAPDSADPGEVLVGVRSGVPVMIWHRVESARPAFEAEIKSLRDVLPELVEHLRLLRGRARQAARPDSHVGSRVSLLWDDPARPVEPQDPPAAPIEEVPVR